MADETRAPLHELTVTREPVSTLHTYHRNPRQGNISVIRTSLLVNGQYRPVVANRGTFTGRASEVLAGNHTLMAARDAGWSDIAVCWVDVDDDHATRIVAADNRTADLGDYDERLLAELLSDLPDLDGTGYEPGDLEELVNGLLSDDSGSSDSDDGPDDIPSVPIDPVTVTGDVWDLGLHRIVCGDCRDAKVVADLLQGTLINVAFTSPPYASQRKYDESSEFRPIPPSDYVEWFDAVQANVRTHLAEDGSWFVNIKPHAHDGQRDLYVNDLLAAHVRQWAWRFVDELCWVDTANGFPGVFTNRFKNAWEPLYHFATLKDIKFIPLANAVDTERGRIYSPETNIVMHDSGYQHHQPHKEVAGKARPSNVISLAAGGDRGKRGVTHSAAFPSKLPAWFIRAYSDPGDAIFDPFMGSGSTLIAADREGRVCYGTEISPAYCDVIATRWQKHSGEKPVRNGKPHRFVVDADG